MPPSCPGPASSSAPGTESCSEFSFFPPLLLLLQSYALPAPASLPHLHAAAVTAFSALYFVGFALYANYSQWQLDADDGAVSAAKKGE